MNLAMKHLVCVLALAGVGAAPAWAESSLVSSASKGASSTLGSLSDSLQNSSGSSSTKKEEIANGDYRIIMAVAMTDRPDAVRLRLHAQPRMAADNTPPAAGATEFDLIVPRQTVADYRLDVGTVVTAWQQPYGVEFAQAETQQPFFLALTDEWMRELPSRPVAL